MKRIEELEKEIELLRLELEETRKNESTAITAPPAADGGVHSQTTTTDVLNRSKLWSRISHAIITPMDAILGMTDLVLDTELTDEQRNYMEMINASADRLLGVVGDVLDYSELIENRLRRDLSNFNLFKELEYDIYIARLSAKHQDLDFSYTFAKDIPSCLNSDPGRIKQVLNNLISNAIKYTKSGRIGVSVENIGYDDNLRLLLKFSVEDTGIGLAPETCKKIFQEPPTLDFSGGEEKYGERGLGLVVSAGLVRLFGGEIGVTSKEGEGTTFWFSWPVIDAAAAYMGEMPQDIFSEKQNRSQVLRGAKILLAEDEYINASITRAFLEQVGVEVTVVKDGREALEALDREKFQAVLMDVQMPDMDGIEATVEIRKREKKRGVRTPIIALTAHAMHRDRERCLQAGMDDYLAKPLDKELLVEMLVRYVTRKALIFGSDPLTQQEIITPLAEMGWVVIIAETCRLAMYEASLTHFDLIILDTSMPFDDGIEAVRTIREFEVFSGCRATILGIGDLEKQNVQSYDGVDAFIAKKDLQREIRNRMAALR